MNSPEEVYRKAKRQYLLYTTLAILCGIGADIIVWMAPWPLAHKAFAVIAMMAIAWDISRRELRTQQKDEE